MTVVILEVAPEELTSFEAGFKSEWLDGQLRVNATAFHYDYDPLQVRVTTGLNQFRIVNATPEVDGFDADASHSYQSEVFFTPGANRYARGEPYGRVNLRGGLTFDNGLEVYAVGRNLNDEQSQHGVIYTFLVRNVLDGGQISPPRTYGAGVRYSF